MRGKDTQQSALFSYLSPEDRVPADHPLRPVRLMADMALEALSPVFDRMYVAFGRPSIAPEKLLRALLLQVLYTIRSERMLMEQLQIQPVVPLVCRPEYGRAGVGADGVQQE
jgi:transposase